MIAGELPVVAEVVRNGVVESVHRGSLIGVAVDGTTPLVLGDVDAQIFARSALKPLQTVALLRAGWQPGDDEQIALACASHSGEPAHLDVVRRILGSADLDEKALDNTPDLPLDAAAARAHVRAGGEPDSMHQNCSGKHAAMLATCVVNGWPVEGYRDPSHPLQLAVRAVVGDLTGDEIAHVAVDGCGAALFSCTLRGLARAFARIASATDRSSTEARVASAMRAHPWHVGGTGRDVTTLMTSVYGLVAKDGAEGVYAAATADGRAVALKVADGAGRARAPMMVAALRRLGVGAEGLDTIATMPVLGHGDRVGEVRAVV
ncbi:MAG TPA: asparaginase [Mycobacteriales bacterium]|nr:asparaginase [Mycobacteriales bacterium]